MTTLRNAGIEPRARPAVVLADRTMMAGWLVRNGWQLLSGGADGADACSLRGRRLGSGRSGCRGVVITGCVGRNAMRCLLPACMEFAAPLHPARNRRSPAVRKLHARTAAVLLDESLDWSVDVVA